MIRRRRALASLLAAAAAGGCVYLNGLYNAERAYATAEEARFAGRDSAARAAYDEAAQKAQSSFLKDPDGAWSDQALYLLGRTRLRRGDWVGAREALEQVRDRARLPDLHAGATLYLGAVAVATGDQERATALLTEAIAALGQGRLRGEGHLWRGRLLLAMGFVSQGWWDLERAGLENHRFRVPAALDRMTYGVVQGDALLASEGADSLLLDGEGARRADTLIALVRAEEQLRGPGAAARLLARADRTVWSPVDRDEMVLLRAGLHVRAADTTAGVADATRVASAPGSRDGEVAARLFLARLVLARLDRVADVEEIRSLLLPVVEDAAVQRLLESAGQLALLAGRGRRSAPLGLFAAAEIARDALGAPALATALFVEYAETGPITLWRGKALLAAMGTASDAHARDQLRSRALTHATDPYVTVALGGGGDPEAFEALERELRDALGRMQAEVAVEVRLRDVLVRGPQDTLSGGLP